MSIVFRDNVGKQMVSEGHDVTVAAKIVNMKTGLYMHQMVLYGVGCMIETDVVETSTINTIVVTTTETDREGTTMMWT